jgi:hypothetical protein
MKTLARVAVSFMALVTVSHPSAAQDVVAGWEGDGTAGYAFVAPTAGIPVTASQSVLFRATASFLYYNSLADGPTDVRAPGGAVVIGYRWHDSRANLAVFGGFERRRIHRRWEEGVAASGEMFLSATRLTQVSALVSYAQANRYTWVRAGAKHQLTNTDFSAPRSVSVGIEATAQGNRDVTNYELGAVLEHAWLRADTSVQFRAGYSRSAFPSGADQRKPYFGIGIYRRF